MKATVQKYKNHESKQAFKVVAPYMEGHIRKSKIKRFQYLSVRGHFHS